MVDLVDFMVPAVELGQADEAHVGSSDNGQI